MSNFNQQMRRAINPTNTLENRRRGLGECLRKIAMLTWPGSFRVPYEFSEHYQAVRARYDFRFGDDTTNADRLILTALAAQVEYNKLREVNLEQERHNIRRKAQGIRTGTREEHQAMREFLEARFTTQDRET